MFLWLGLVVLAAGDLHTCEVELGKVLERFLSVVPNDTYSKMASYSGKWINDLGNYFDCIDLAEADYALFSMQAEGTYLYYSLCGPANCTVENYMELLYSQLLPLAQELRSAKFGIQQRAAADVQIGVLFPQHFITEHFGTLNSGAIVMVVFCSLLGMVMLAGTAIDLNRQFGLTTNKKGQDSSGEYMQMTEINSEAKTPLQVKPLPQSLFLEVLVCFSVYTNFKKLFASRSGEKLGLPKDSLEILNGVRVMSMGWVILGHVYLLRMDLPPIKNMNDISGEFKKVKTAMIYSAVFSVDTFFWLSGFLMAFLLAQQLDSPRGMQLKGWVYLYFHRFYRILPAYMFVLLMCWAFTKYLGDGPVWFIADNLNQDCHHYWWTNMLFLNNFLPNYEGNGCLPQSWYLANDMQFFWLSPPLFYIYYKVSKVVGWALLNLAIAGAIVSSAVVADVKDYNVVVLAPGTATENADIYIKPYCRAAPYAIGIMCGLILYTQRNHAKTGKVYDSWAHAIGNCFANKYFRYAGYCLGLFLINFFIFIQYNAYKDVDNGWTSWSRSETSAFYGLSRPCWAVGISLLFLPMLLGHWKLATWFLSLDIWTPLARLTFCTYLVHIHLIIVYDCSANTAFWFNDLNIAIDFFFVAVTAYAAAIPLTLAVESPFMALEKVFKGKRVR